MNKEQTADLLSALKFPTFLMKLAMALGALFLLYCFYYTFTFIIVILTNRDSQYEIWFGWAVSALTFIAIQSTRFGYSAKIAKLFNALDTKKLSPKLAKLRRTILTFDEIYFGLGKMALIPMVLSPLLFHMPFLNMFFASCLLILHYLMLRQLGSMHRFLEEL